MTSSRAHRTRRAFLAALVLVGGGSASCRCRGDEPGGAGDGAVAAEAGTPGADLDGAAPGSAASPTDDDDERRDVDAGSERLEGDASTRFRDAGPGAEQDLDAPPDPACTGAALSFAEVVVDERCAIDRKRAERLRLRLERADAGAAGLAQNARTEGSGVVVLRLVNRGTASVTLPLTFHGKLPAFSVLAEDAHHSIYELSPPYLALRDPGQGARAHIARIVLPPGGSASARVTVERTIARVLGRGPGDPCRAARDAAACDAAALPAGHYVLHVGQLLADVPAGEPARVEIDLP